jgi:hypothetical protein
MRHRHSGKGVGSVGRPKQPSCQLRAIGGEKLYVDPIDHFLSPHLTMLNGMPMPQEPPAGGDHFR